MNKSAESYEDMVARYHAEDKLRRILNGERVEAKRLHAILWRAGCRDPPKTVRVKLETLFYVR